MLYCPSNNLFERQSRDIITDNVFGKYNANETSLTDFFFVLASCESWCGEQSRDGCYCDTSCVGFDDCCEDFEDVCPYEYENTGIKLNHSSHFITLFRVL